MTPVRPLRDDDVDAWIRLRRASFGQPRDLGDAEARAILASRVPFSRGVDDDGELVAACTWFPFPAWIGGVRVTTGALAAVVSAPASRRRGHVRELVLDGLRELHEAGVGWSLEYPFDPRFYARLGYRAFPNGVVLGMPIERLPGDAREASFAPVPDLDPKLRTIRARFAAAHGFALDRDDPPPASGEATTLRWRRIFEPPSNEATPATAYRTDGGYAIVATEGFGPSGVLHVVDAAWTDADARRRVLAMLTAWRGQVGTVRLDLPAHDPLALAEAPEHARERPVLQGRIVDVVAALTPLRPARPPGRDAVSFELHDPQLPWNDGTWRAELREDGCVVERLEGGEVDMRLGVDALAAALAGVPPAALHAAGDVEGDLVALHALAATTADHPPFQGRADHF